MATKKQLIDRWKQEPWSTVDRRLIAFSTEHAAKQWTPAPLPDHLFGLLNGLPFREEVSSGRDLRGSSFPGACNMDLHGTDFSFARQLGVLQNCRLDQAVLNDLRHGFYALTGQSVGARVQRVKLRKAW